MENIIKKELESIQEMLPEGYSISELSEIDKDTAWDMAYLISCVDTNAGDECESDTIIERMKNEIKVRHEDEIKTHLRTEVSHFVISRLESYDDKATVEAKPIKNDVRLKFAPPWVTFVHKIKAMFGDDPDITVVYENAIPKVYLTVNNVLKASAIDALLPIEQRFGNVNLLIEVMTKDGEALGSVPNDNKVLFETAFKNNPAFSFARRVDYDDFTIGGITYVVFANRVVQFFNDNLNDNFGNVSTLYQEIAKDIFTPESTKGVFFSTDIVEKTGMPLDEWP